jgi:gamma-glutamyltranspeptidase / glutathione hydrolase
MNPLMSIGERLANRAWLLLVCLSVPFIELAAQPLPNAIPSPPPVRTRHAMVVSIHHEATDAGVAILKQGGNAVDAAVAVGFALAVVYPDAGNIGGGGFMMLRLANGQAHFLDFRERAPFLATANMYLDAHGNVIPDASTVGYRAIGVPGTVAGLAEAQHRFGKLSLAQDMAPAIRLAKDGFVLSEEEAAILRDPLLSKFPESRRLFQRDGHFYAAGDVLRQPELARTLERIQKNPRSFYHGALGRQLVRTLKQHGALIRMKDLSAYRVKDRQPLLGAYRGYQILAPPPPSSGGVAVLESLNILEAYDLNKLGDRSPQSMHLIVEAYRRAFMDRTDFLGDPDYTKVPVAPLISKPYAAAWRSSIDPTQATPSKDLKRPAGFLPEASPAGIHHESANTTHYSVLDEQGNAVSVTYTLNNSFGSGVAVEGLGFLLNDEMDDFTTKAGAPNMFGLIQGGANAIGPGKRPLSSMTPVIVLKDGRVRFLLGSPGGPRIITTVANIFLSATDGGLNIQQAVDAPRFHHQYLPDILFVEPGFPAETLNDLRARRYTIQGGGNDDRRWSDGECIAVDPETGWIEGGQDQRHHFGKAAGY